MSLLEHENLMNDVEAALRSLQKPDIAQSLLKLQQDMGLEMDPLFDPDTPAPPGPQSAALYAAYEPVTPGRVSAVMLSVYAALPDALTKKELWLVLYEEGLNPPSPPGPAPAPFL